MSRVLHGVVLAALLLSKFSPVVASEPEETPCDQLSQLQTDADNNDPKAQVRLSKLYFSGHCVSQDINEGAKWLARATKLGYGPAQRGMGLMFYTERQYDKAAELFRQAAEQGDAQAQILLASMYLDGKGVEKDDAEAAKWAKLAGKQGNAYAQALLGSMYYDGKGVAKDDSEAAKWARLAAEQGNSEGQEELARLYYHGGGVPQDYIEADKWFILADDNMLIPIVKTALELKMSKQDVAEAKRRADAWKPKPNPQ
jgi:uncharacterized protein